MAPAPVKQLFNLHETNNFRTNITTLRRLIATQPRTELNMMGRGRPYQRYPRFPMPSRPKSSPPTPKQAPLVNPFRYRPCSQTCEIFKMRRDVTTQRQTFPNQAYQSRFPSPHYRQPQPRSNIRALEDAPAEETSDTEAHQEPAEDEEQCCQLQEDLYYEDEDMTMQDF